VPLRLRSGLEALLDLIGGLAGLLVAHLGRDLLGLGEHLLALLGCLLLGAGVHLDERQMLDRGILRLDELLEVLVSRVLVVDEHSPARLQGSRAGDHRVLRRLDVGDLVLLRHR
jgi:hypothetical protein